MLFRSREVAATEGTPLSCDGDGLVWLPSRQEMSAMLGMTVETASRLVSALKREGAVIVDPANIPSVVTADTTRNFLLWNTCGGVDDRKGRNAGCSVDFGYGMKRDFNAWLASLGPDGWRDHGQVIPEGTGPGTREWAGSAVLRDDGTSATLFFTAAGRRGQKPSFEQRLFGLDGLRHGAARVERAVRVLKHDLHLAPMRPHLAARQVRQVRAKETDATFGPDQPQDRQRQRGLA